MNKHMITSSITDPNIQKQLPLAPKNDENDFLGPNLILRNRNESLDRDQDREHDPEPQKMRPVSEEITISYFTEFGKDKEKCKVLNETVDLQDQLNSIYDNLDITNKPKEETRNVRVNYLNEIERIVDSNIKPEPRKSRSRSACKYQEYTREKSKGASNRRDTAGHVYGRYTRKRDRPHRSRTYHEEKRLVCQQQELGSNISLEHTHSMPLINTGFIVNPTHRSNQYISHPRDRGRSGNSSESRRGSQTRDQSNRPRGQYRSHKYTYKELKSELKNYKSKCKSLEVKYKTLKNLYESNLKNLEDLQEQQNQEVNGVSATMSMHQILTNNCGPGPNAYLPIREPTAVPLASAAHIVVTDNEIEHPDSIIIYHQNLSGKGYGRSVADVTGVNAGIGAVPGQMGPIVSNFQSRHASEVPLPITNGNQFRPSSTLTNSGMELPIDIERTETTGLKYAINMKTRSSTPPNNNLKEVSRAKQVGMGAQLGQGQNLTHPNVAPQTNLNGTVYEAPSASKPSDFDQILQTKIQKITILNDRIKRQKKSSKKLLKKTKKQSRVIDAYKRYCKRHGLNGRYEIGDFVSGESESESSDTISVE